jgi:hypothetical protein
MSKKDPKNKDSGRKPRRRGPRERVQKSTEFYSRLEVAQKIGCGPTTIAEYERLGKLTPYKFGYRILRYAAAEVEKLIQEARAK